MKFNFLETVEEKKIKDETFDLVIFSCGYEIRSSFLIQKGINYRTSVCFLFENETSLSFKKNLEIYKEKLVHLIYEKSDSNVNILQYLSSYFDATSSKKIKILVDYSSMSRIWYSSIIFFLKFFKKDIEIELNFLYCIPKFETVEGYSDSIIFEPVEYISQITIPDKPTALIISLGDTERQAIGLKEYFDAEETYCFYATSKYKSIVLEKNKSIIETLPPSKIIGFPLRDVVYTKFVLENLCRKLQENYRIVIAPCGPKTFTLASFLVSSSLSKIDVWRISKPGKIHEQKIPTGEFICIKMLCT